MEQSQKSLFQSEIPDFFAAKETHYELEVVHNYLHMAVISLLYHCQYITNFILLL